MNIQLFLEDEEVELNKDIPFALNKTYEDLYNPINIIVEHSKTINIPCTARNNLVMANAYRIDRQFVINENAKNIGLNLDPMKRIGMKLIYNGSILLDGYAKYTGATMNDKESFYTFNLYGALGDVFQKLLDCVFDENKLTEEQKAESDGGAKYIIDTPWDIGVIDKNLIKRSWEDSSPSIDFIQGVTNSIGFAPAYRGAYSDFESNSILGLGWNSVLDGPVPTEPESFEDALKRIWKNNLTANGETEETADAIVDAVDFESIIPNGLLEHNMKQFRSYEQKPYIYIFALMQMYIDKCRELTGYTIELDPNWFNGNNPYWIRLCYMFDYLSVKGTDTQGSNEITSEKTKYFTTVTDTTASYSVTDTEIVQFRDITVLPFTLTLNTSIDKPADSNAEVYGKVGLWDRAEIFFEAVITTGGRTVSRYFWGGVDYATAGSMDTSKYNKSNFVTVYNSTNYDSASNKLVGRTYMNIPGFSVPHDAGDDLTIEYKVTLGRHRYGSALYSICYKYRDEIKNYIPVEINDSDFSVTFPKVEYATNWRNTTTTEMKNLYSNDESLFKVILQYTKMFGLIWKVDYNKKTISILTKKSYFSDYEIVDWTDKVAHNKGFTVEPVSFNSKYVDFNYKDTNGFRYTGYKNKYGVDYGEKRLRTKYSFDTNSTKLFTNEIINPSSASCKSFVTIDNLLTSNGVMGLQYTPSVVDFIDCENEDESAAIQMNNWYFRNSNRYVADDYFISDVSSEEILSGKYYWIANSFGDAMGYFVKTDYIPQFSPVFTSRDTFVGLIGTPIGCLYNCPNEDYTRDKNITAANGNYIYDNFWKEYINERYNSNNKKLTCYIRMTPVEYEKFNFKQFILIDNQLFMMNKIIDFNLNESLTKVELIQVSNVNNYITQKLNFPDIAFDKTEITITPTMGNYGATGSASLLASCYPSLTGSNYTINPINTGSSESKCFTEGADVIENTTDVAIYYESDGLYTEEYEFVCTYNGNTYRIPIYINPN